MDAKTLILTNVLNCGYMDIDFIIQLLDDFEVEIDDIEWKEDANSVIHQIFDTALNNAGFDFDLDYSIYTNYLDSHLYVEGEEINDISELKEAVKKLTNKN